jgi:thermitase
MYLLEKVIYNLFFVGIFGAFFGILAGRRRWTLPGMAVALWALWAYVQEEVTHTLPYRPETTPDPAGELLLELREGSTLSSLEYLGERYGLRIQRAFYPADSAHTTLDNYYVADIPAAYAPRMRRIARQLGRQVGVAWVEENEIVQVAPLRTDPPKSSPPGPAAYGLNDPGVENLWAFREMNMAALFDFLEKSGVKPKKKALVAILDTGVEAGHEDLNANYRSLKPSYDNDPKGHGTHCAGIAGAVSNNGTGIASFSRDNRFVEVTSVKVLGAGGFGTQKTIIEGMLFAADQGADVLSLSLGGPGSASKQGAYAKAVQYAQKKGAIVVAAAGNSNRSAKDFTPANVPGVLCVSAVDETLERADFSNDVQGIGMALAAPGVDIYSSIPGGQYAQYSGTSMAAPHVAGMVGLMKSIRPEANVEQVYKALHEKGKETKSTARTGRFLQPAPALRAFMGY